MEHEIELHWCRRALASSRIANVVLVHQLAQLGPAVVVDLGQHLLILLHHCILELDGLNRTSLLLFLLRLLIIFLLDGLSTCLFVTLQSGLEDFFDKVVCS